MKYLFISYSRQDTPMMQRITTSLRRRGFKVWADEELSQGSASQKEAAERVIDGASAVIALLSPDAKSAEGVAHEIAYAQIKNRIIFPVLLHGDSSSAVPAALNTSQRLDLTTETNFNRGLDSLIHALNRLDESILKLNGPNIRNELVALADAMPKVICIGLVSVDGLMVEFYRRNGYLEEDQMSAMSAAMISLGERIASDLGGGRLHSTIITGDRAMIFEVLIGEDHVCIVITEHVPSIDQTLAQIEASAQRLSIFL